MAAGSWESEGQANVTQNGHLSAICRVTETRETRGLVSGRGGPGKPASLGELVWEAVGGDQQVVKEKNSLIGGCRDFGGCSSGGWELRGKGGIKAPIGLIRFEPFSECVGPSCV